MPKKAVIMLRGDLGAPRSNYSRSMIDNPTDDTALTTFLTAFAAHTDANIAKRSIVESTGMTDSAPGASVNVDRRAILYFRHPTTLKTHSFSYCAPVAADTEKIDDTEGERVKGTAVTAVVADISTLTGISYDPLYGVVEQGR